MTTLQVEIVCIEFDFVSNRMLFSWTMDTSCRWNLMEIQMHSHHYTSAVGSRSKFKFDMFAFPSTSKCFQSPWIPRPILWRISCLQKVVWGAGHKLCYLTCFKKAYLLLSNTSSSFHWTLVSAQLCRWKQGMLSFRLLLWDESENFSTQFGASRSKRESRLRQLEKGSFEDKKQETVFEVRRENNFQEQEFLLCSDSCFCSISRVAMQ